MKNKSKKKKLILIISAVIVIIAVLVAVLVPKLRNGFLNIPISEYLDQDLKNVDNIELIADCAEIDSKSDTVAGVKETLRLGAKSVIVDLCFRKDGTPVMCKNYSDAEKAPTVESLFKAMNEDKYTEAKIYLRIVQLSELSKLNELSKAYNVLDRLYLLGIDEEHYGLLTSDETIIPFFLSYKFNDAELKSVKDSKFKPPEILKKYGAVGLIVDCSQMSPELADYLDSYEIPFVVDNAKNDKDLCIALLNGSRQVIVDDIQRAKDITDTWIENMQKRNEISVSKSLKDLSATHKSED